MTRPSRNHGHPVRLFVRNPSLDPHAVIAAHVTVVSRKGNQRVLGLPEADLKNVAASIQGKVPAGRFGTATEIAHAALFFASDESAFTVGSELLIDGGMSAI